MSDPIADILRENDTGCADGYVGEPIDDYDEVAKQIRQQIGRELLDKSEYHFDGGRIVWIDDIREVCQLENEND